MARMNKYIICPSLFLFGAFVAPAIDEVVVYEAAGLHVGVDYGAADELEAAFYEVFA